MQIVKGRHQITAGLWFQRIQDNENTASRQLGQASFSTLTTFLQGPVTSFQVVPSANELGWRSLFGAAYFEDAIKLWPNLTFQAGLRYEFTTGWNEESGRAANYITDGERRARYRATRWQLSVYSKQCDAVAGTAPGSGVGCIWQRKDGGSRRLRHLLFADRRSQFPAQLAPAV